MSTRNVSIMDQRRKVLDLLSKLVAPWVREHTYSPPLKEDSDLLGELGLDSVGLLHFILDIEREFDIKLNETELDGTLFSRTSHLVDRIIDKTAATLDT